MELELPSFPGLSWAKNWVASCCILLVVKVNVLGAEHAWEKVHSPSVTYFQNCWCRCPMENLEHILFRDNSSLHSISSYCCLPRYPLRGHLHANIFFLLSSPGRVLQNVLFVLQWSGWRESNKQEVVVRGFCSPISRRGEKKRKCDQIYWPEGSIFVSNISVTYPRFIFLKYSFEQLLTIAFRCILYI